MNEIDKNLIDQQVEAASAADGLLEKAKAKHARVCIQFDECKPHWAKQRGYLEIAAECGLTNITVGGDFDAKLTYIYGDTADYEAFSARFSASPLGLTGSIARVAELGGEE